MLLKLIYKYYVLFLLFQFYNEVNSFNFPNNDCTYLTSQTATLDNPQQGDFNHTFECTLSPRIVKSFNYTYLFNPNNQSYGIRIEVTSNTAHKEYPVLFVVRQERSILSWQIPLVLDRQVEYKKVAHTLCPLQNYASPKINETSLQSFFVDVSSARSQNFTLRTYFSTPFLLSNNEKITVTVTASTPYFFQYIFPSGHDFVQIQVHSSDSEGCMVVSIQNIHCPVFDLDMNVGFRGLYQTMTQQAAITVQREDYPEGKFYVVLVIKASNEECKGSNYQPARSKSFVKVVTVMPVPTITAHEYINAALFALLFFAWFYVFSFIISAYYFIREWRNPTSPSSLLEQTGIQQSPSENMQNYGTIPQGGNGDHLPVNSPTSTAGGADSDTSLDETDLDLLPDADFEKDIVRTKTFLFVSDLSRKREKKLDRKARLYTRNLLTIAIFYAIPVIQLVYTYQRVLHMTGNQDICFYNYLCAHPFHVFTDFNHVFSNIGYIILGILFVILVWRREKLYQSAVMANPQLRKKYGIPQHYGLFYSMGVALMMEGLLSACYHICPNYSNFQFDTAFMYVIATLYMLKIYQTRHPDINAHSHSAYLILALVVAIGVFGVLNGSIYFWVLFVIFHLLACMVLSMQIYYMGRWKLDKGLFKRVYLNIQTDISSRQIAPLYLDRFILLAIANIINWSWSIHGLVHRPRDFSSFLLAIFLANLILYLAFYIIMKLRHKERVLALPLFYIILSFITWIASLYFFLHKNTSWQQTPAQSREHNHPCIAFNFYDHHDIWHFLSSAALFFSFMVLLTLDDDLILTPRDRIPVF